MTDAGKQTHRFQAEVTQVLSLVINSLYSNKDIFLRELISNASDALDKLRFRSITEPELLPAGEMLRIRIFPNRESGTLTLWDNGIGMTAEELADHLGTVAKSGSRAFLESLEAAQRGDLKLIGQFGVGFYSAYLVADRVEVVSRAAGTAIAHRWSSDGKETFSIEPAERETQGTSVILHLKKEHLQYLDEYQVRHLVERYSDYLSHPIELEVERTEKEGEATKKIKKLETINRGTALWQRSEVTKEQYEEFYKHLTHDWEPPLTYKHFRIEGNFLFSGMLFVPKQAPFDLFAPESEHGVRLYVRRVFIMDHCKELLPRWLRFMRGVIDSEDLPLNVSREILQDSAVIRVMRKQIVKQTLDLLESVMKEQPAEYQAFWSSFGAVLKEGLHFEPEQSERLAKMVRYSSSKGEGWVSLEEYKARMPEEQKAIYYALGESRKALESSPHLEGLKKRGYEVLYMTDPVDSFAISGLPEFDGVPLVSASSTDLKLAASEEEEKQVEARKDQLQSLLDRIRARLEEQISEVRVSTRLTDSPACLVVPEGGLQPHLERLLRGSRLEVPMAKRVLEINPTHPLIANLEALHRKSPESEPVGEWIDLLYDQALLAEGSPLQDPARFVSRLTALLEKASAAEL